MPLSDEARAAVEWHFKTMELQGQLNVLEDATRNAIKAAKEGAA